MGGWWLPRGSLWRRWSEKRLNVIILHPHPITTRDLEVVRGENIVGWYASFFLFIYPWTMGLKRVRNGKESDSLHYFCFQTEGWVERGRNKIFGELSVVSIALSILEGEPAVISFSSSFFLTTQHLPSPCPHSLKEYLSYPNLPQDISFNLLPHSTYNQLHSTSYLSGLFMSHSIHSLPTSFRCTLTFPSLPLLISPSSSLPSFSSSSLSL